MDEKRRQLLEQLNTVTDPRERIEILRKLEGIEKGEMKNGSRSNRKSRGGGPITIAVLALLVAIGVGLYVNRVSERIQRIPTDTVSRSTVKAYVLTLVDERMKAVSDSLSEKIAKRTKSGKVFKEPKAIRMTKRPVKKKSLPEITVAKSEGQGKTKTLQPDTLPAADTVPKSETLVVSASNTDTIPKPDTLLMSESDTLPVSDTLASDTLSKSDTLAADTLPKDKLAEQRKEKKVAEPGKGVTLTVKASQDMARIFFNRVWASEGYRSGSNPVFQKVPPSTFRINVENEAGLWSADAASLAQGSSHFEVTVNGMKMVKMEDNGEGGANFVFTINPDGTISP